MLKTFRNVFPNFQVGKGLEWANLAQGDQLGGNQEGDRNGR